MKCTYLINMEDGRLEFRDEHTEGQINLKPIPDEIKSMIVKGEVSAKDVINAISIRMKESGDFNINDYLEGLKKLNVRKSNRQEAQVREELPDVDDAVSVAEVMAAKNKAEPQKKTRAKKINEVLDEKSDDMFKDI